MKNSSFARNIRPFVEAELQIAADLSAQGRAQPAFTQLERAHVLGQASTAHHVRVHWRMFLWGLQQPPELEMRIQQARRGN